jgi:hypothetical protein
MARWLRITARSLAMLWAGLWMTFGLVSGIAEGEGVVAALVHTVVPGLIFLVSALTAFKWDLLAGILLVGEGLVVLVGYPLGARHFPTSTVVFVLLTMALPPLVAGLLLLLGRRLDASAPGESLS